ncbi:protein SUPPRESSOR OF FRI 4-like [Corylus avellana]|uniref:protein SUPPRESSOR OF FRI 4-like n=1 Tax=Corylus avellana TaxID=13451 RepID=UPI00286A77C8|nr:protein SUPPRESSOR OF FRI 4-like [Corylus avellana]
MHPSNTDDEPGHHIDGRTQCFNQDCPGYAQISYEIPLDWTFVNPDGKNYSENLRISKLQFCNASASSCLANSTSSPALPYPQHPAVSVPPPPPLGYAQQPLFPVPNARPPLQSPASSALQPSQITPPGLPVSTPSAPVSQPLFPVIVNNNIPTQSSPFSAPVLSTSIMSSSPAELKGSIDPHSGANALVTSNYQAPNIPGGPLSNSHSYASGPNTGGPSIGPPPVIANKAPATQPATNEVYLVWDDEAMSMEERRMSLTKYQVHDETSQVSYTTSLIYGDGFASNPMGRLYFSCFQIQFFTLSFLFGEVFSV